MTFFPNPLFIESETPLSSARPLGLYLHLPYCRTKCTYCAFVSGSPRSDADMDRYLDALLVHLRSGAAAADGRPLSTIFLGGGTPSLMGPDRLQRLFEAIHDRFTIARDVEWTIEANPESATLELFERLAPLGLNRVSMGVQSFDDDELLWLGRVHSVDGVYRAIDNARRAGIDNISLDLIFGLPGQTMDGWTRNIDQALACQTEHLSSYALSFEEGTLLERLRAQGKTIPAPDDAYADQYERLRERLDEAGFDHYELSNWSRPGRECRHNMIYWRRDYYLAFGVSAHGYFNRMRYGLMRDPRRYVEWIESHADSLFTDPFPEPLMEDSRVIDDAEAASDAMIFGLRLTGGVDYAEFELRYGQSPESRWGSEIDRLVDRGMLERTPRGARLAPGAYFISNEALSAFLD